MRLHVVGTTIRERISVRFDYCSNIYLPPCHSPVPWQKYERYKSSLHRRGAWPCNSPYGVQPLHLSSAMWLAWANKMLAARNTSRSLTCTHALGLLFMLLLWRQEDSPSVSAPLSAQPQDECPTCIKKPSLAGPLCEAEPPRAPLS